MPRFSIRHLLIATAVVAIGCFALMKSSSLWASLLMGVVVLTLAAAVLLAIFRDSERRAYWIGFAFVGWLYVVLCFGNIFAENRSPFGWTRIITAQAATALYDRIYLSAGRQPPYDPSAYVGMEMGGGYMGGSMGMGDGMAMSGGMGPIPTRPLPDRTHYLNVAHALWTLLLAVCGGWFAQWLYATRARQPTTRVGGE
jgi:hypothetical protein